ncbi:UNVERIFIED_CONTAM: hypothetical protein RMT77_013249 [Armadillidium vulgare]
MSRAFFKQSSKNDSCSESISNISRTKTLKSSHEYRFVLNCRKLRRKTNIKEKFRVKNSKVSVKQIEKKCSFNLKESKVNDNSTLSPKYEVKTLHIEKKDEIDFDFAQTSCKKEDGCLNYAQVKDEYVDQNSFNDYEDDDEDYGQTSNTFLSNMFKRVGSTAKPLFECQLCYKQIKESSRKQHSITHAGLKPFSCCFCGARFTRKGDTIRHRRTVHGNIKMLSCSVCNKKFSDSNSLIFHLQNHDKMFSYVCAKCGFKFGKKEYFESHIRYIHPSAKDQSIIDMNEVISKGKKQLETLKLKNAKSTDLNLLENFEKYIKEENVNDSTYPPESIMKSLSSNLIHPCSYLSGHKECDDTICKDSDNLFAKCETLSFNPKLECEASSTEYCKKDEDLVNLAIKSAISQAKCTLEKLSTSNNINIKLNKEIANKTVKNKNTKKLSKNEFGYPEIHITANFDGMFRKFIIYVPNKNLNPLCKEGLNLIANIVNHICCGKGEIIGAIEIEIRQT